MKRTEWIRGDKTLLAKECGITKQYLSVVLKNGGCSAALALRLADEATRLGYLLTAEDVMFPSRSINPLVAHRRG